MKYTPQAAVLLANRFLEAGDAVLEIGACDGAHTAIYAARIGLSGTVLAVEPRPNAIGHLSSIPSVTVRQIAVSDYDGRALFYQHRRRAEISSLIEPTSFAGVEIYPVDVTTIDTLVQAMPQTPALIHVDAQGAEAAIVRGASRTLRLPIVWVIELWPSGLLAAGDTVEAIIDTFESLQCRPHDMRGRHLTWSQVREHAARRRVQSYTDLIVVPTDMMVAA